MRRIYIQGIEVNAVYVTHGRTSDSSRERVGELLHVLGFCLRLVLLPSEDDLNSTLREEEEHCQIRREDRERRTERKSVFVPWRP